jgi:1-aminocyclopropane-1-carboxylate deaminase/D-cysteine desulfhydrase-like pyridoxal-dependent ACC family enzyme
VHLAGLDETLDAVDRLVSRVPRRRLATLPTALESGVRLPSGAHLHVLRDDLTGLGLGGNKARKLEFLVGEALAAGCDTLVTVGAAQSNHCRMTAAAGAVCGLATHLVLSGERPDGSKGNVLEGNVLLSARFGAHLHFTGVDARDWDGLENARAALADELTAHGARVASLPIGGSTAVGAIGYVAAFAELVRACASRGVVPGSVVFTSSSGGTHAGLVAGAALLLAAGHAAPELVAVGVAKGVIAGQPHVADLAREALVRLGADSSAVAAVADVPTTLVGDWLGPDYGVPTEAADDAIDWAARHGGWVLDRVYTGKGFAGLLGLDATGRFHGDVVFIHTGGVPSVFTTGGSPGAER